MKFDFDGRFYQSGNSTPVDRSEIIGFNIYINAGLSLFTGDVYLDNAAFGDQAQRSIGNGIPGVKVNQMAFIPMIKIRLP